LKSKRVWLGILAGIAVTVTTGFFRLTCLSVFLGVIVAAYVSQVSGPKQGAVVGAIVILPLGVLYLLQMQTEVIYGFAHFPATTILQLLLVPLLFAAVGALFGAIMGLIIRALKGKQLMF
jgi:hypothetical protein